ncbi:MAG: TMEM165/GDT1 family protein [bacterium]
MINYKLLLSTFILVFMAELGDKTQVAGFAMAAKTGKMFSVFLGASLALVAATLIAVIAGSKIARVVPERAMKTITGIIFIATGAVMLVRIKLFGLI